MSATTTRATNPAEKPAQPVNPAEDQAKLEAEEKAGAEVKAEVKGDVKTEAKGKEADGKEKKQKTPEDSYFLTRPYAKDYTDPDKYHAEFFVGGAWSGLDNGKSVTTDHKGLSLGADLRLKFPFGKNNAFYGSAGLRYQYNKQSFDLNPGESHFNSHKIGLTGGIAWRAVPEWLSIGAEVFLAPDIIRSSCNTDEEGFCDGESGTVFNLNAQANPLSTTGFHTGAAVRVGIWRDIINLRIGGGKTWGSSGDIETATQGTYSQPFSPGEFNVVAGINFAPLFSKKTWAGSTYKRKPKAEKVEDVSPELEAKPKEEPAAKKPEAKKPEGPKAPTAAEYASQFEGHKSNIEQARDRIKTIYSTDLKDTRKAPASVLGGSDAKKQRMQELVEEAKTKGTFAQLEYLAASQLLGKWSEAVSEMPEGAEKTEAQAKLDAAKSEFSVKKDGQESIMELNHSAYRNTKRAVDYFNHYAKSTKGVDQVAFDLDRPEGYAVKSTRPSSRSKSKSKDKSKASSDPKPKSDPKPEKSKDKSKDKGKVPALDIGGE